MPDTFFDPERRRLAISRLCSLRPDTPRRWGTMTAPRMIAHLSDQMAICLGDRPSAPMRSPMRLAPLRYLAIHLAPWPKGAKASPDTFVRQPESWAADLARLLAMVLRFGARQPGGAWPDHPRFGRMSGDDWAVLSDRHFDHHLRQFGA